LIERAIAKANDLVKYLGLPSELKNLEVGVIVGDLGLDTYGKALSPILMIVIDIGNILDYVCYHSFDVIFIKDLLIYSILHEVVHVYLDVLDLYSVYQEYEYFKYVPEIHDMYVHKADLTKSLSMLGLSPVDFGDEISHDVIRDRIIKTLDNYLPRVSNDRLRKSLCDVIFLFSELIMMHYDISSCEVYDYNCIHSILSSYAKKYKELWDESYDSLEFVEKEYNLANLRTVIMGIISGFFMYEHNRRLIRLLSTYPFIETLCYYIPAKVLFGDISKALLMPIVNKFYRLMKKLEHVGFNEVMNVVREPSCIIEKLSRLGFHEVISGSA